MTSSRNALQAVRSHSKPELDWSVRLCSRMEYAFDWRHAGCATRTRVGTASIGGSPVSTYLWANTRHPHKFYRQQRRFARSFEKLSKRFPVHGWTRMVTVWMTS